MHLLVALDDSEPGRAALEYALSEHPDAEITVVHVVDPTESGYGEFAHLGPDRMLEHRHEQAENLFEEVLERASERDRSIETAVIDGRPAAAIVEYAHEHDVDRIVVGSHGRTGVSRVVLGSVAERIARRAPVPVTIVPGTERR
ncbi:universal stress protein [Halopiger djelfimassiliensis]|uniref:universal stress protein n=1 Tax=Halopiger djelfimassiliensis TaxID=1293047 RepID=UPI000677BD63|nr:universal stress protein [Halopiger djelfimassiliensis]